MSEKIVLLLGDTIVADTVKRYKTRNHSKVKTSLDVLARAQQTYAFGKPEARIPNTGFGKFTKVYDKDKGWVPTERLKPVRMVRRVETTGILNADVEQNVNQLLRNILLFKGIGFDQVAYDLRVNGGKAVTYMVNVRVRIADVAQGMRYNPETNTWTGVPADAGLSREFKVHNIIVKKVFRETLRTQGIMQPHPVKPTKTLTSIDNTKPNITITRMAILPPMRQHDVDMDAMWAATTNKSIFFDGKVCKHIKTMMQSATDDTLDFVKDTLF